MSSREGTAACPGRAAGGTETPVIELRDVSYSYGDDSEGLSRNPADNTSNKIDSETGMSLSHVNLRLYQGHTYVLTGPNGCGKSTLLRILAGLSFPTEGAYLFHGEPVTEKRMHDRRRSREFYRQIGFLFQNSETQLFCKSVREEIAFGLLQLGLDRKEAAERTQRYMELLKIDHLAGRAPFHLSGGEKKRTALAAVLAMQPGTLILDEPEAGLDEEGEEWITRFLDGLGGGERTIVIATHSRLLSDAVHGEEIRMTRAHKLF